MARTRRSEYLRSNRVRAIPLPDPEAAAAAAEAVLAAQGAGSRQRLGAALLSRLCGQAGLPEPELVVPDEHQPHRRAGRRIVYSLQGDYRRRAPSPADPSRSRDGRPLGRIRVPNRTPARGEPVRPTAFLNTLLHEFAHHYDAEALGLLRSFHTAGFYARLRHLRDKIEAARRGIEDARRNPPEPPPAERDGTPRGSGGLRRLWGFLRGPGL